MKEFFSKLYRSFNLFRFNTVFGIHQKATGNKAYKWWHESKIANPVHFLILAVYIFGVASGFYAALPRDSKAALIIPEKSLYYNPGIQILGYNLSSQTEFRPNAVGSVTTESPAIFEDKYVWADYRNVNVDIYLYNLTTNIETRITSNIADQTEPAIYGDKVVWQDMRNGNADIYMYNLTTQTETQITSNVSNQYSPAIYGDKIVWTDYRNLNPDIYMYNLTTLTETQITANLSDQVSPDIYGDKIVWTDYRNLNADIYMYNLTTLTETQITTNLSDQGPSAIDGDKIVWTDFRNMNADIYMYNLTTLTESQITNNASEQYTPDISGNRIVWEDFRNGQYDIYTYDLIGGVETRITSNSLNQNNAIISGNIILWVDGRTNVSPNLLATNGDVTVFENSMFASIQYVNNKTKELKVLSYSGYGPDISGNKIVWYDSRNGNNDIYMYDLVTKIETQITSNISDQIAPKISGNRIVWHDFRNGNYDIYMYDLVTKTETQITSNLSDQLSPVISGDKIVWQDSRNVNTDIYMYDLITQTESQITNNIAEQYSPSISGNYIVWTDNRNVNPDIYMYNIGTSIESQLTSNINEQSNAVISGDKIVWQDWRNSNYDIYMYDLTTLVETQITTDLAGQTNPNISGGSIVWLDSRRVGVNQIYLGIVDYTPPVFENLPATNSQTNLIENQIIRTSPVIIKTKPTDIATSVTKVEYYVNGTLKSTVNTADNQGIYESSIDLSSVNNSPSGVTFKARAYDESQNYADFSIVVKPDPWFFPYPTNILNVDGYPTDVANIGAYSNFLYGDYVFYDFYVTGVSQRWVYNIKTGTNTRLNADSTNSPNFSADDTFVYLQYYGNFYRMNYRTNSGLEKVGDGASFHKWNAVSSKYIVYPNPANLTILDKNLQLIDSIAPRVSVSISNYAVSEQYIVWTEADSSLYYHMYSYNINTRNIQELAIGGQTVPNNAPYELDIENDIVTWADSRYGNKDIFYYDISQNLEFRVTASANQEWLPDINNNRIAYRDSTLQEIFLYDISTNTSQRLTNTPNVSECHPSLYGDYIAYESTVITGGVYSGPHAGLLYLGTGKVDIYSPESLTITPTTGEASQSTTFTVTAWDNDAPSRAEISMNNGAFVNIPRTNLTAETIGSSATFSGAVPLPDATSATFTLKVYDAAGNAGMKTGTLILTKTPVGLITVTNVVDEVNTAVPVTPEELKTPETKEEPRAESKPTGFFQRAREIVKKTGELVAGAFQAVVDTAVEIIKLTPPAVARTFPYLLFILLGIMAVIFFYQARSEAEMSKKLLEILNFEKVIYEDKENFLTLAAHYLRTPTTLILNGADMLSLKDNSAKKGLLLIAKDLSREVQSILAEIDASSYLSVVKKPNIEKKKISLLLSPFLLVPIVLVGAVAVIANILFVKVANIDISTVNFLVEIISYGIAVQVFFVFGRRKYTQKRNREEFEKTLAYERAVDRARNKFVENVMAKITPFISEIEKAMPKTKDKMTETIKEGKHRLSDILYKFALLVESTKGGFKILHPKAVSLKTQAKVALSVNEEVIKSKKLKVKEAIATGTIKTDPRKVEYIVSSLISNAVKFTNPGTTVGISSTKQGRKTEICVTDQGPGISEEGKLHLFKPFTRTTSAIDFNYEGFGLSLYLSKILVNSLGGDIALESKVGKGTTVKVLI